MAKMGMGDLLKQAQKMQENMQKAQEELAELETEGSSGGGMVTVTVNGKQEIVGLKIAKEVVDSEDIEMLEDLVLAAVNQALEKSQEMASQEMNKVAGGMMPPGFKLPGM